MTGRRASALAAVGERRLRDRRAAGSNIVALAAENEEAHWRAVLARELTRSAELEERVRLLDEILASQHEIIAGLRALLGQRVDPPAGYHDPIEQEATQ